MAQGPESEPQQAILFAQVPAEGSEGPDRLLSAISLKKCPFYGAFFGGLGNGGSDIRGPHVATGQDRHFGPQKNVALNVDILVVPPKGRS